MRLSELIRGIDIRMLHGDADIHGISTDSRSVKEGDLFFAMKGLRHDGNLFIDDAIRRGAVAVVTERPLDGNRGYAWVEVEDIEDCLACVSSRFYGNPSESLTLIGITGTNGKTTTSYLIREIFEEDGRATGLIGTVRYMIRDRVIRSGLTTPLAVQFQELLAEMVKEGVEVAIAEVSSHGLSLKRVDYCRFNAALFTNLSRDHLDYHHDMEGYFSAKKRLFIDLKPGVSVVNSDDPYGRRLYNELRKGSCRVVTYGLKGKADFRAVKIIQKEHETELEVVAPEANMRITSPLIGMVNVYNILAAVALTRSLGVGWHQIVRAISRFRGVEGRLETVRTDRGFLAVIDYAHTPDALRNVLETLRGICRGRLITVFGCGGDRDRGKRPEMGAIATEMSDLVVITSDNPRTEPPELIIEDIKKGIKKDNYRVEPDRREAIFRAVGMADRGDLLLIAGKGHEDYQEIRGVRYRFNDREVLLEALKTLKGAGI